MITIRFKRLPHGDGLPLPKRMSVHAAGFDFSAAVDEPINLKPGERTLIPTGFIVEIPINHELQIRPRSGLAIKNGISIVNSPGTVDSDYRGEVKIIVINHSQVTFTINRGDRIAQAVLHKIEPWQTEEVNELSETERHTGGFGSTGLN
ncbi:dUTP diphosphatase [Candidatus Margulisiibacteriota bacterium]